MPLYDGDLQLDAGIPAAAERLGGRLSAAQGMLIASPEYNYSLPGSLKNAIDWLSRLKPQPLRGRSCFLLSASNNQYGGIRGLWQLRVPLEGLGVVVNPDMFTLPWAEKAFGEDGTLVDPERQARLEGMLAGYLDLARRLAREAPSR
jgi:NAD(P)H-dependent FMN reductase